MEKPANDAKAEKLVENEEFYDVRESSVSAGSDDEGLALPGMRRRGEVSDDEHGDASSVDESDHLERKLGQKDIAQHREGEDGQESLNDPPVNNVGLEEVAVGNSTEELKDGQDEYVVEESEAQQQEKSLEEQEDENLKDSAQPKKRVEPFNVPTSGAFYMHDTRFDDLPDSNSRKGSGKKLWDSKGQEDKRWVHDRFQELSVNERPQRRQIPQPQGGTEERVSASWTQGRRGGGRSGERSSGRFPSRGGRSSRGRSGRGRGGGYGTGQRQQNFGSNYNSNSLRGGQERQVESDLFLEDTEQSLKDFAEEQNSNWDSERGSNRGGRGRGRRGRFTESYGRRDPLGDPYSKSTYSDGNKSEHRSNEENKGEGKKSSLVALGKNFTEFKPSYSSRKMRSDAPDFKPKSPYSGSVAGAFTPASSYPYPPVEAGWNQYPPGVPPGMPPIGGEYGGGGSFGPPQGVYYGPPSGQPTFGPIGGEVNSGGRSNRGFWKPPPNSRNAHRGK